MFSLRAGMEGQRYNRIPLNVSQLCSRNNELASRVTISIVCVERHIRTCRSTFVHRNLIRVHRLEGNLYALTLRIATILTQIEGVLGVLIKTINEERVLIYIRELGRLLTCRNTSILPSHTILIVIPREGSSISRNIRNAQTLRHTASQTTDLEVINCTRSVTRIRVISPYDNNFMVASLRYFNLAQLTLPIRLSAQFATAIQCNPTIR